MSYIITKTDGSILATTNMPNGTLIDGTTDSSIGVTLIGRNFPSYGALQNENFVRLVENFADNTPPTESLAALSVLTGTVWYDTVNKKLKVYDGTNWNLVGGSIVSATAPTTITYTLITGDHWYNSVTKQLNVWNGTSWEIVGPAIGTLQQWNTLASSIPAGFHLCDGSHGTPDLTAYTIAGTGYSISYIQKIS
jgi:hypothetical protein